jgi:prepilin-type N-terminal cleavage/methylation domain-containing protein
MSARRKGFSLIELIIVIVVIAIAAVAIGSAFAYTSRSLALNQDLQRAWQIAQECADHILGQARKPGLYTDVNTGTPSTECNVATMAVPAGYTRTLNITTMPASNLCASGWSCKRVQIIVARSGGPTAELNFMVVHY